MFNNKNNNKPVYQYTKYQIKFGIDDRTMDTIHKLAEDAYRANTITYTQMIDAQQKAYAFNQIYKGNK